MVDLVRVIVPEEIRVDRAAKRYLGNEQGGKLEQLLDLNPGLAAEGGWVPAGYRLLVPAPADEPELVVQPSINPWE